MMETARFCKLLLISILNLNLFMGLILHKYLFLKFKLLLVSVRGNEITVPDTAVHHDLYMIYLMTDAPPYMIKNSCFF